jgi:hypothetical protein
MERQMSGQRGGDRRGPERAVGLKYIETPPIEGSPRATKNRSSNSRRFLGVRFFSVDSSLVMPPAGLPRFHGGHPSESDQITLAQGLRFYRMISESWFPSFCTHHSVFRSICAIDEEEVAHSLLPHGRPNQGQFNQIRPQILQNDGYRIISESWFPSFCTPSFCFRSICAIEEEEVMSTPFSPLPPLGSNSAWRHAAHETCR